MGYVCTLDLFPVAEQQQGHTQPQVPEERSKMTENIIGQKEVQAHVVDYQGQKSLLFVFAVRPFMRHILLSFASSHFCVHLLLRICRIYQ